MVSMAMLLLAAQAGPAAAAPLPAIAPSSRWGVDAEARCALSRDYDSGGDRLSIAFRTWPFSRLAEVIVVTPMRDATGKRRGAATIAFDRGAAVTGNFGSYLSAEGDRRIASLFVPRDALAGLGGAATLTVTLADEAPITVRLTRVAAALASRAACDDKALRDAGLDPQLNLRATTPAIPLNMGGWITADDYPAAALRSEVQGRAFVILTVGVDGSPSACTVLESSGSALLDDASCAATRRRARFTPAAGADGQPVPSYYGQMVNWILPG